MRRLQVTQLHSQGNFDGYEAMSAMLPNFIFLIGFHHKSKEHPLQLQLNSVSVGGVNFLTK